MKFLQIRLHSCRTVSGCIIMELFDPSDPGPRVLCLIVVNNDRKNKVTVKCPCYTTGFWHTNRSHNSIAVKEQGIHYPSDTPTSTSYHGVFIVFTYSRTSMARTLIARLPWLIRTRFKSLRNSSDSSRKQIFKEIFLFYREIVCCVYLLELPHRGNSKEYTQHTITV